MQSGITASEALHAAFQTLLTDPTQLALLITIQNETLIPTHALPNTNPPSTFPTSLSLLTPSLRPLEPSYIIFRPNHSPSPSPSPTPNALIAISYIPTAALVRSKMLFASTRLTLVRCLGSEHFTHTRLVSEMRELEPEAWESYERDRTAKDPLTEQEELLKGEREMEAQSRGSKASGGGSGLRLNIEDDARRALDGLSAGQGGALVQLKIDPQREILQLASSSTVSIQDLHTSISLTEPRFSFFHYSPPSAASASSSSTIFIYTCPATSKPRERMLYASAKNNLLNASGVCVDIKVECSSPADIEIETLVAGGDGGKEKEEEKGKEGFKRPRRPGRR